jgi:hypothetical protein
VRLAYLKCKVIRKHSGDSDLIESSPEPNSNLEGQSHHLTQEVAVVQGTRRKVDWNF